ncbi:MAG: hypothetical protein ACREAC_12665, partial [Blastocatellia bacterium]
MRRSLSWSEESEDRGYVKGRAGAGVVNGRCAERRLSVINVQGTTSAGVRYHTDFSYISAIITNLCRGPGIAIFDARDGKPSRRAGSEAVGGASSELTGFDKPPRITAAQLGQALRGWSDTEMSCTRCLT